MNYKLGSYGHLNTRLKEADTVSNIDILILGSSHAYRGFDPRIFEEYGISIFVLGSSSQSPIQANMLAQEYLTKLKPRLVIYEVFPSIFGSDGVESSLDVLANHELNLNDVKMSFSVAHIKTINALLYDIFRESIGLNESFEESLKTKEDEYVKLGYVEKVNVHKQDINGKKVLEYRFLSKQLKALSNLIDHVNNTGSRILLVQAPVSTTFYKNIENNEFADSVLATFSDYYNFNGEVDLVDSTDFYDLHHLSQHGVEKFNQYFIRFLFEEGHLN